MIAWPGLMQTVAQAATAGATVAAAGATFDSLIVKLALAFLSVCGTAITAMVTWLVTSHRTMNRNWAIFEVGWYGDPKDKNPNGAKRLLYTTAADVAIIKQWMPGYDTALGALATDNDTLRKVWKEGDPERRSRPRLPRVDE